MPTILARPSGPTDRWLGFSLLYGPMYRDYLRFLQHVQQRYGDVAYMKLGWEHTYDVFHPELIRTILVEHADHLIRWERGIAVFAQGNGQSVLTTEGEIWQRQRRILQPGFSPKRVAGYAELMTQAANSVFRAIGLEATSTAGIAVNINTLMTQLTMRVILQTLFSQPFTEQADAMARAVEILLHTAQRDMYLPISLPTWLPLPSIRKQHWAIKTVRGLITAQIAQRRALRAAGQDLPHTDILMMLLNARDESQPNVVSGLTDTEIADQCHTIFTAGHETTATALIWWCQLMAEHPDIWQKVQSEVAQQLGTRRPEAQDAEKLTYLQATLKEVLRMYPPAPALMTRRVTQDIQLGAWRIPKRAMIRITPWVVQHDARWFKDPDMFRPERFLPTAENPPRGAWLPFGVGPRVCIGQHFSMLEMTLLSAMFVQAFEIAAGQSARPKAELNVTLRPAHPIVLTLKKRQHTL